MIRDQGLHAVSQSHLRPSIREVFDRPRANSSSATGIDTNNDLMKQIQPSDPQAKSQSYTQHIQLTEKDVMVKDFALPFKEPELLTSLTSAQPLPVLDQQTDQISTALIKRACAGEKEQEILCLTPAPTTSKVRRTTFRILSFSTNLFQPSNLSFHCPNIHLSAPGTSPSTKLTPKPKRLFTHTRDHYIQHFDVTFSETKSTRNSHGCTTLSSTFSPFDRPEKKSTLSISVKRDFVSK